MITIDCGERRHLACVGYGNQPYLIPQEAGREFECRCRCHFSERLDDQLADQAERNQT